MSNSSTSEAVDYDVPVYGTAYNKIRRVSCQITGQMARYERNKEEEKYSVFYCSMFFFLLSSFICGIIMTAFGGMSFNSCPESWVPIWLLVEGLIISTLFIVLFCGESKGVLYFKVFFSFSLFTFLAVWTFLGILWSVLDNKCSYELSIFSFIISIICSVFVIMGILTWIYWCCNNSPCKKIPRQQNSIPEMKGMMGTIQEE